MPSTVKRKGARCEKHEQACPRSPTSRLQYAWVKSNAARSTVSREETGRGSSASPEKTVGGLYVPGRGVPA